MKLLNQIPVTHGSIGKGDAAGIIQTAFLDLNIIICCNCRPHDGIIDIDDRDTAGLCLRWNGNHTLRARDIGYTPTDQRFSRKKLLFDSSSNGSDGKRSVAVNHRSAAADFPECQEIIGFIE